MVFGHTMTDETKKLIAAAVVGAVLGIVIGYAVFALNGPRITSITIWLSQPVRFGVYLWAGAGAIVLAGIRYTFR